MKKFLFLNLLLCLLLLGCYKTIHRHRHRPPPPRHHSSSVYQAPAKRQMAGRETLREIVKEKYPDGSVIIGATIAARSLGTKTGMILDREFSYVTPENDFKQTTIHPDPQTWNWTLADKWPQHIIENKQILRMHCPIGPQCSKWTKNDNRTAQELIVNEKEFLTEVCKRYNNKQGIEYIDVVNETVIDGKWHKNKPGNKKWECPWYIIGLDNDRNRTPLYIKNAFVIADKYAPNLKFIYNHHEDPTKYNSWNLIKETIKYLRNQGLRVDGIGWQAHVNNNWATQDNLNDLDRLIKWAHANNLEFHVTEASVWLKKGQGKKDFEEQAFTYQAILKVLLENHSTGKVGWNTWHVDDGHGWRRKLSPALFDAAYTPKPAYFAIRNALEDN